MKVMKHLTLPADWDRLPALSDPEIQSLVASIQVENEKTSPVRYLADMTIEFKKADVRRLLRENAIPFTETRARPTLLLPLFEQDGDRLLFDDDNPWLTAWSAHSVEAGAMFPLVIPIGDLADVAAIDGDQALATDEAALLTIAKRYQVKSILVAYAALRIRQTWKYLDITLQWHGPVRSGTEVSSLFVQADEPLEALLARGVVGIVNDLERKWKEQTLLRFDEASQLSARVPIEGLKDWLAVQRKLANNGMIRRFDIASITTRSVQIHLRFLGRPNQLAVSLAQDDLELVEEDSFWTLYPRQRGSRPGGPKPGGDGAARQ